MLCLIFLGVACSKQDLSDPDPAAGIIKMEEVVNGINQMGWDLYRNVTKEETELKNVIISPTSIASAMYMAYSGSASETKEDLAEAMYVANITLPDLQTTYQKLYTSLNDLKTSKGEVGILNSVFWDENRVIPHDSYLDQLKIYFDSQLENLDFGQPMSLEKINQWVKMSTQDRIKKIIDKIEDRDVMFLLNALFLKADWDLPFSVEATQTKTFQRPDNSEVNVPFMFQDNQFPFFQDQTIQAIELPLVDSQLATVFLSPRSNMKIDEFLLTIDHLEVNNLLQNKLTKGRVHLHVPKFKVEYKVKLNDALKAQGMEVAFDKSRSDFSNLGISPQGNLYISNVDHRTFLEIDEKGVEGAAVTSVTISADSLPPIINFDHPFVVIIYHKELNVILFLGEINDPVIG